MKRSATAWMPDLQMPMGFKRPCFMLSRPTKLVHGRPLGCYLLLAVKFYLFGVALKKFGLG